MKYKVGDKVKIKENGSWNSYIWGIVEKLPDRTVTIIKTWLNRDIVPRYEFEEIGHVWGEEEIECLVESMSEEIDRFILMDFD